MKTTNLAVWLVTLCSALAVRPLPIHAQQVTIDFEGFAAISFLGGSPVPESARLSNQLAAVYGAVFSSDGGAPYAAVVALGPGHATSGVNGFGSVTTDDILSYATPARIHFVVPSSPSSTATVDFVSLRGDLLTAFFGTVSLEAFDQGGTLLGSDTQIDSNPVILTVRHAGIHSIRITQETGSVAFDDLTFSTPAPAGKPRLTIEVSHLRACWNSETNKQYQVQYRSTLTTNAWVDLGEPIPGNGTTNCITESITDPRRFYRVCVLP